MGLSGGGMVRLDDGEEVRLDVVAKEAVRLFGIEKPVPCFESTPGGKMLNLTLQFFVQQSLFSTCQPSTAQHAFNRIL